MSIYLFGKRKSANESDFQSQVWEEGYLEGSTRLVFWKVLERLIDSGLFSHLHLSSPFRVGYQFHDQELIVLRILNWPKAEDMERIYWSGQSAKSYRKTESETARRRLTKLNRNRQTNQLHRPFYDISRTRRICSC